MIKVWGYMTVQTQSGRHDVEAVPITEDGKVLHYLISVNGRDHAEVAPTLGAIMSAMQAAVEQIVMGGV